MQSRMSGAPGGLTSYGPPLTFVRHLPIVGGKEEAPMKSGAKIAAGVAVLFGTAMIHATLVTAQAPMPKPVLVYIVQEPFATGGKQWIRYRYQVENNAAYPDPLFAASPNLPPCGLNTKASRTWVDVFDKNGKRLNGFCALGKHDDLNLLWFALEEGVIPPSYVYIEMTDRQTNTKVKSNEADTTN
jgi:hypothetical protein